MEVNDAHDLKELDYDDEEFNMNEQSEEGTAVDYDSQVEGNNVAQYGCGANTGMHLTN